VGRAAHERRHRQILRKKKRAHDPRDAITELDDRDLLKPPFDRSFKRPGGFLIKHKLEAARERAGSPAVDEVGE